MMLFLLQAGGLWAQPGGRPAAIEEARVTNPASGVALYVQLYRPAGAGPWPALVLVPGGSAAGSQAFGPPEAQGYADLGFLVVVFDPDGRGRSAGVEDDGGFVHQDGLAAVVRYAAAHRNGDGRVVLASYSYGVTLASGALARHPDLPMAFFVDWEGPANRNDTGGCDEAGTGHLREAGCANEAFWAQREAATFMPEVAVPYQRVQTQRDHVQPDNGHALLLVNRATDRAYGGQGRAPWTRLNDLPPTRPILQILTRAGCPKARGPPGLWPGT